MRLYLDSSALVKLVRTEEETAALRRFLRRRRDDGRFTSVLARVEIVRAVVDDGPEAVALARSLLSRIELLALDATVADDAATLGRGVGLRSLDAIHVASARVAGGALRAVITYDQRMAAAAQELGLVVVSPA